VSYRVFLSHAWADRWLAGQIARRLALRASDTFVFVVPEREGAGKHALFELGAAHAMGKRIVAIVPTAGRFSNADVARVLSGSAVLDASAVPADALAEAIMMPLAA
jgi:hypothetical protein